MSFVSPNFNYNMDLIQNSSQMIKDARAERETRKSTQAMQGLSDIYRPAITELHEKKNSMDLVDRAQSTAGSRFERGVQAADHIQGAMGGMTTRQQALAQLQNQRAGRAIQDASINLARTDQDVIRTQARDQLVGIERDLFLNKVEENRHRENLTQQREMHNERVDAEEKAAKRSFWGTVGGIAVGAGAAMLL